MRRLIAALLIVVGLDASAALTWSTSNDAVNSGTSSSATCTLPNSVSSGAAIVVGIRLGDESTTISSVSDPVNGNYSLRSGATDAAGGTFRSALYSFENSAALSGTDLVITASLSGSVAWQIVCAFGTGDTGNPVYSQVATPTNPASNTTDCNTNTISGNTGSIIGFIAANNAQTDPEPSADAGETRLTVGHAGARAYLFSEITSGAGTYGIDATCDNTTFVFHLIEHSESSGSSSAVPVILQQMGDAANDPEYERQLVANAR